MSVRRVAYVVDGFPKVSETFVAGEIAAVRRRGIDVRILSLRPPDGGPVHEIVTREGLQELTEYDRDRFSEVVAEFRPQLIHAHFARGSTAVARALAAEHGVPYTFTVHGYDLWRKPPDDLDGRAAAAGAVVTVSHANAQELGRRGAEEGRVHVIPCGIDVADFTPGTRRADPPLILAVARLRPVKCLDLLLHALAGVRRAGVAFDCRIIGEGAERPGLEALRDALDLRAHVRLTGAAPQHEVRDAWRLASIGVLTSRSEGMPIALMEAAASGVPVVATAVGGVPELVEDGVTGLLAPSGDASALTAGLVRLLRDVPLRDRMSGAARVRALERFSVDHQVERLTALWDEVARRVAEVAA